MSDKPILKIPVDSQEFDAFLEKFQTWQKTLEEMPDAWRDTNKGIKQAQTAFDDMEGTFSKLVKASIDPKFSSPDSGVFRRLEKSTKETEKGWRSIAKDIEHAGRNMTGLVRNGMSFAQLGMLGAVGGIVGAAGGATVAAANDLAQQNAQNRALGLAPGEENAFDTVYARVGGDSALLAKIASAQSDPTQWTGLLAAGISQQDITSKDPTQLAAEFLQRAGAKFNAQGTNGGLWAQSTGVSAFATTNQLRQAGSYGSDDYARMGQDFTALVPKLAANQKTLDEATQAQAQFAAAFARTELEFEKAFLKLAPDFTTLATDVADAVTAFAGSGELDRDIQAVRTAFDDLAKTGEWLSTTLNTLFGFADKKGDTKDNTFEIQQGGLAAKLLEFGKHPIDVLTGKDTTAPGYTWDYGTEFNNLIGNTSTPTTTGGSTPTNNPGNLETPGKHGQFQQFDTEQAGVLAMDRQLMLYAQRDHLNSITELVEKYAPAKDGNDDPAYIADVAGRTGFDPNAPLDMNDPNVRAMVEAAMIRHEQGSRKYVNLDANTIKAMLTGNYKAPDAGLSDPQIIPYDGGNPDDKLNPNNFQIVQYDQPKAQPDTSMGDAQGNIRGLDDVKARLAKLWSDTFGMGAGSQYRTNDPVQTRIDRQGNTPGAPYQINVSVTTPAGSSTVVTSGGLPQ
jgi:hypothetical protein